MRNKHPLVALLSVGARGFLMGCADVVPGVSGGTIAFITGVYGRFISALTQFDLVLLRLLIRFDIKGAWRHVDGNFLAALFAGILFAILSLAHAIGMALHTYPVVVWSLFSGLILASAIYLLYVEIRDHQLNVKHPQVLWLLAGMGFITLTTQLGLQQLPVNPATLFLGGMIAISAMLLPGVSGSFLLLMLGLYEPTIDAIRNLDIVYLLLFATGAGVGFLAFSRVIHFMLERHRGPTLLFLIGLLFGSLQATWPWRLVVDAEHNITQAASWSAYQAAGLPLNLGAAAIGFLLGVLMVAALEVIARRGQDSTERER